MIDHSWMSCATSFNEPGEIDEMGEKTGDPLEAGNPTPGEDLFTASDDNASATFDAEDTPLEDPFNEGSPNFLPKADSAPLGAGMAPSDSFFDDVDHIGAFGEDDWTAGWTAYPAN